MNTYIAEAPVIRQAPTPTDEKRLWLNMVYNRTLELQSGVVGPGSTPIELAATPERPVTPDDNTPARRLGSLSVARAVVDVQRHLQDSTSGLKDMLPAMTSRARQQARGKLFDGLAQPDSFFRHAMQTYTRSLVKQVFRDLEGTGVRTKSDYNLVRRTHHGRPLSSSELGAWFVSHTPGWWGDPGKAKAARKALFYTVLGE